MKKFTVTFILAFCLLFFLPPTIYGGSSPVTKQEIKVCEEVYKVSAAIMTYRQSGMSIINSRKQVENFKTPIKDKFLKVIVMSAYRNTRYFKPQVIDVAISEFANSWYGNMYEIAQEKDLTLIINK